jgi:hypothetical protein
MTVSVVRSGHQLDWYPADIQRSGPGTSPQRRPVVAWGLPHRQAGQLGTMDRKSATTQPVVPAGVVTSHQV